MSVTWGDEILNCECNLEPVTTLIFLLQKQITNNQSTYKKIIPTMKI